MNTIKSTWAGWGALCLAGGGAYFFAKRSINADRENRHIARIRQKQEAAAAERAAIEGRQNPNMPVSEPPRLPTSQSALNTNQAAAADGSQTPDVSGSPSEEFEDRDPAPTRHAPDTEGEKVFEKGKYEASEPFRPKPGNRFS